MFTAAIRSRQQKPLFVLLIGVVTEAGFVQTLVPVEVLDIKRRATGLAPSVVVLW